jgi:TonB family protein
MISTKKTVLTLTTILFFFQVAIAQTPVRKKIYHKTTKNLVEEYDAKDSASTFKVGYYARYNAYTSKMTKTGNFKENVRTGIWTFYDDSSKVHFRYNYTTGLVLFAKPDTMAKYFLKQAGVDTNFYKDLSVLPVFVGGSVEYKDFIAANLRYPAIAKENEIKGKVVASFEVTGTGFIENPKIVKPLGYGCDDEVLRVIKIMPRWVPGRKTSEVRQLYYMTFNFGLPK